MQLASQTTESPETAKKRLGLLAVLAVGVDAAASFLKSKMEKAAAVASQVGAAVLKSTKAVSAAAAAVLVRIRPEPPKKARLARVPLFVLLIASFIAQPQGMAVPRGVWLPKYEEKQEFRTVTQYALQTYLWDTEIEFSSEYKKPGTAVQGKAVEEKHKAGRIAAWSKKTTYLTWRGNKTTVHEWINRGGNKVRQIFGGTTALHLDLVFHTKVGEIETVSTLTTTNTRLGTVKTQERINEKWKNKVFFHKTQSIDEGPFEFSVHFGARNDFIPYDDLNCTGYCEAGRISAYPGPAISVSPCVPSNMSMPFNGYLEFHHWTQYVPDPDDDDE